MPITIAQKRKLTRSSLAAMFADIPRKRRAYAMRRAWELMEIQLREAETLTDTKFDEKGRIVRFGTNQKDRATIVKETLQSMKLLAEIYRDSCEHDAAVERLITGIFGSGNAAPVINVHLSPGPGSTPNGSQSTPKPPANGGVSGNPA